MQGNSTEFPRFLGKVPSHNRLTSVQGFSRKKTGKLRYFTGLSLFISLFPPFACSLGSHFGIISDPPKSNWALQFVAKLYAWNTIQLQSGLRIQWEDFVELQNKIIIQIMDIWGPTVVTSMNEMLIKVVTFKDPSVDPSVYLFNTDFKI